MSAAGRHDSGATRTLNPRERLAYGAIVTFSVPDGRYFSLHRLGNVTAAVRLACEDALRMHDGARVKCISTPDTIYADLHGRTIEANAGHRAQPYEAQLLGRLGLLRMLDPSITSWREQRSAWRRDDGW